MTERIPNNFLEAPDATISVDFTEFATGKGVIELFAGSVEGGNRLSNIAFYSDLMAHVGTSITSSTLTKILDVDFDLDIQKTLIIEGDAVVVLPLQVGNDEDFDNFKIQCVAKIRKWDGTTETEIATATGTEKNFDAPVANQRAFVSTTLNIVIPRTVFRTGESLRLTIEIYTKSNDTADIQICLMADPKGRLKDQVPWGNVTTIPTTASVDLTSDATAFSICSIQLPVKVDV